VIPTEVPSHLSEIDSMGRLEIRLPAGTRWQIDTPTDLYVAHLVLTPAPRDIRRQLAPYAKGREMRVRIERLEPKLMVARIELLDRSGGPLLVRAKLGWGADTDLEGVWVRSMSTTRGVVRRDEGARRLVVHTGRMRRVASSGSLCETVRTPLPLDDRLENPKAEDFRKAEALFAARKYEEALPIYRKIARGLRDRFIKKEVHVSLGPEHLARLRIGDASVCLGKMRVARLRYEFLKDNAKYGPLNDLIRLRFLELSWPSPDPIVARGIIATLEERDPPDELYYQTRIQAARVALLLKDADLGFSLLRAVADERVPKNLVDQLLLEGLITREAAGDYLGVALLAHQYQSAIGQHPRGAALAVLAANAMRRVGAPMVATKFLQRVLEDLDDPPFLLLAVLARSFREAGDGYRAQKTLQYLREELRAYGGWLGRREEVTISLAAGEIAVDNRDWKLAQEWLMRADAVGGGPAVRALLRWVQSRVAVADGALAKVTKPLFEAVRLRKYLIKHRRAEVVTEGARHAMAIERPRIAEAMLREFMVETQDVDEEVEVGFLLARSFEAQGKLNFARGMFEDVGVRFADTTFGQLAEEGAARVRFRMRNAAALAELK
jgi:hypothetical protein